MNSRTNRTKAADYEEVLADHRRLVRELDVAMHGTAGAAKQASLCDLIEPARKMALRNHALENALAHLLEFPEPDEKCEECKAIRKLVEFA